MIFPHLSQNPLCDSGARHESSGVPTICEVERTAEAIGEDPGCTDRLWLMMYRGYFYPAGREKLDALGAIDLLRICNPTPVRIPSLGLQRLGRFRSPGGGGGAIEQQLTLARVLRERGGALELRLCLG